MQMIFIEALAAISGAVSVAGLATLWRRLTKIDKKGPVTITRQDTHKTVVLPREYSPSAVKTLAELVA